MCVLLIHIFEYLGGRRIIDKPGHMPNMIDSAAHGDNIFHVGFPVIILPMIHILSINLCILMNSSFWFDTINSGKSIVYIFRGVRL